MNFSKDVCVIKNLEQSSWFDGNKFTPKSVMGDVEGGVQVDKKFSE